MIWEVFRQEKPGDYHTHCGDVHAPDAEIVHHGGHTKLGQNHPHYRANRERFHQRWVRTGLVDRFARQRGKRPCGSVSVCVIALNEQEYIESSLESVYPLADRIIVVEGGNAFSVAAGACTGKGRSLDRTAEVVTRFKAEKDRRGVVEFHRPDRPWKDKTEARQFCLDMLEPGDWCLALDADEVFYDAGLWRLSALMHEHDYITFGLETFWRDFGTVGVEKWRDFFFNMRCFRVRQGDRYRTHLQVVNAEGTPIDRDPPRRKHHEAVPLAAHYPWVKPLQKIRRKLDYYRGQCRDRPIRSDYLERIFLRWPERPDEINRLGTHPMGGGTCEPWTGRHPEPIQRRLEAGLFGWIREVKGER